jgi:hypothetical protein
MRKIINYPELLEDYLNGEKISYIGVKHDIHPANVHVIVRRFGGKVRPRSRPRREKWLKLPVVLPAAAD